MLLFSHCEILKLLFSQYENIKNVILTMWRHVMYCMQRLRFDRNMFKNQRKCNKQEIQWFDDKY